MPMVVGNQLAAPKALARQLANSGADIEPCLSRLVKLSGQLRRVELQIEPLVALQTRHEAGLRQPRNRRAHHPTLRSRHPQ